MEWTYLLSPVKSGSAIAPSAPPLPPGYDTYATDDATRYLAATLLQEYSHPTVHIILWTCN